MTMILKNLVSVNKKLVLRMGFEPMIFAVRGQYPKPLDERSIWLAQKDSNHRPLSYQDSALPLSYVPVFW